MIVRVDRCPPHLLPLSAVSGLQAGGAPVKARLPFPRLEAPPMRRVRRAVHSAVQCSRLASLDGQNTQMGGVRGAGARVKETHAASRAAVSPWSLWTLSSASG